MTEAITGILIALAIGAIVWFVLRARVESFQVYVPKFAAKFWKGKGNIDKGFTQAQKLRAYEKQNRKCAICGKPGFLGEANERGEQVIDAVSKLVQHAIGKKNPIVDELEAGHRAPRSYGFPSIDENLFMICRSHNRKDSDKWTAYAEAVCKRKRWTVYLEPSELKEFQQRRNKQ